MKKILAALLCVGILLSLGACAASQPTTAPTAAGATSFEGLSQTVIDTLKKMGYTEETWSALSYQEQQALLTAAYAMIATGSTTQSKGYTLEDVEKGGQYMITVSDGKLESYFELYYREGILIKMKVSILQEDGSEEVTNVSKEEIDAFGMYGIDYSSGATAVVNALKIRGFTRVYIAKRGE